MNKRERAQLDDLLERLKSDIACYGELMNPVRSNGRAPALHPSEAKGRRDAMIALARELELIVGNAVRA